jgi:acyl-CoA synthetase (NDP forming)
MAETEEAFQALFDPRSVAVIGASGNPLKMGHQCLLSLRDSVLPGSRRSGLGHSGGSGV